MSISRFRCRAGAHPGAHLNSPTYTSINLALITVYNTAHLSIGQTGSCGRLFGRLKSLVATHVPVCKKLHRQISTTHTLQGSFWGVGGALPTDGAVHSNLSYYSPTLLSSHDTWAPASSASPNKCTFFWGSIVLLARFMLCVSAYRPCMKVDTPMSCQNVGYLHRWRSFCRP